MLHTKIKNHIVLSIKNIIKITNDLQDTGIVNLSVPKLGLEVNLDEICATF